MWVVGVLPSAWIVQLTLPMWIGVCTSYAHDFAHSNPANVISCVNCLADAQGAPVSQDVNGQVCKVYRLRYEVILTPVILGLMPACTSGAAT